MNSKKGFTLIELLAVIVILAIIALIAVPIVLNIINDSKESSDERSIELYGEAVEQAVAKTQLNSSEKPLGKYTSTDGKTLTNGTSTIKVEYKGTKVVCDVIISQKGTVSLYNCKVNDKEVEYTYGNKIYSNGEVVYFDVDKGKKCTNYTETQSKTEVKKGCMKFYAFNDDGGDKLNLILDHNTTATLAWNLTEDEEGNTSNKNGPVTLLEQLNEDTKDWKGTITPEKYKLDQSSQPSEANYTIDYSGYKARIITAQEVAQITGNTSFNETTSITYFYFDTNTTTQSETCKEGNTTGCKYGWLYDRTDGCTDFGCLNASVGPETYGYWTAAPNADDSSSAWSVYYDGSLFSDNVDSAGYFGVRPVITVLKSNL